MEKIANLIKHNSNFAILAHSKTDCDAVCSAVCLKLALEGLGKKADVLIDSNFADQMQSLPHFDSINQKTLDKYDLYICVDTATIERLGRNKYKIMKNRAISCGFDHHGTNKRYCKYNYINENYSSTCELLYDFFKLIGAKITREMAHLMIVGIYTDSGQMTFSCVSPKTMRIASELLKIYGGRIDEILVPIYRSKTMSDFCLVKITYDKLEIVEDDQIAIVVFENSDLEDIKSTYEQTHGIVDIGLSLKSVQVSLLASEDTEQKDCYYVSIRTKGNVSAREIAEIFGGSGHFNAAGCKIFDTKQNVHDKLINATKKVLNKC